MIEGVRLPEDLSSIEQTETMSIAELEAEIKLLRREREIMENMLRNTGDPSA